MKTKLSNDMNVILGALVRRIKQRAYLDSDEEIARWIEEYCEQSNSHKHSVVRESPPVKEEIDLYLKGQRDTIKLLFDYILGLDEPLVGAAVNHSGGFNKMVLSLRLFVELEEVYCR